MALKASQGSASALLGFLQSLQQGQDQRNQQREGFLQQKQQQFDSDRAFKLQADQFGIEKDRAERAKIKEDLASPLDALARAQALAQPNVGAQQTYNAAVAKSGELKAAAGAKRLAAAQTRNPQQQATLLQDAAILEANAASILSGERNAIGLMAGVTIKPWETQAPAAVGMGGPATGGMVAPAPGSPATGGVSAPAVGPAPATGAVDPFAGLMQQKPQDRNQLPLTAAEMELLGKTASGFNLGGQLGLDYFARPTLGFEQTPAGAKGQLYGRKSFIKQPTSYDPDYNKFIADKSQSFVEMLNEVGYAADQNYIPREQAFESILGKDKTLWPVIKNESGEYVPKQNWWSGLSSDQKTRFTSRVSKFITPSESMSANAKDMRSSVTEALTSQIAQNDAERKRRWELYDNAVELQNKKDVARISNVNTKDPQAAAVLETYRTDKNNAYESAKGALDTYKQLGNSGTDKKETAAELLGIETTTLENIELSDVAGLYASAERIGRVKLNTVTNVRNPDLSTQMGIQTQRYGLVAQNALMEAATKKITEIEGRPAATTPLQAKKKATIDWIKNRAGISTVQAPSVR